MEIGGEDRFPLEQWSRSKLVGVEGNPVTVNRVVTMDIQLVGQSVSVDFCSS